MGNPQAKSAKKITLRDKKKAQPSARIYFSDSEKTAIIETVAKDLSKPQVKIFFYQCQALGLNPLLSEICAIVYNLKDGTKQMSIQVMRDGFLTIAHRSGKFAGMRSGVKWTEGEGGKMEMVGWAKVWHKDFEVPLYQEADFKEYNTGKLLWASKPKTMIKKVAESMALRKAFNVSGVYAAEEMEREINNSKTPEKPLAIEGGEKPATEAQIATIKALDTDNIFHFKDGQPRKSFKPTKQKAADLIKELAQKKGKKGKSGERQKNKTNS